MNSSRDQLLVILGILVHPKFKVVKMVKILFSNLGDPGKVESPSTLQLPPPRNSFETLTILTSGDLLIAMAQGIYQGIISWSSKASWCILNSRWLRWLRLFLEI
jgi:hypothetical protein